MTIGILKETQKGEKRVSISPKIAKALIDNGFNVVVEDGAGKSSKYENSNYSEVGAKVEKRGSVYKESEVLIKINPFDEYGLKLVDDHHVLICQLFHKSNTEIVKEIAARGATVLSMDAIPRISRAQDMDVLSTQNNLAGYKEVIKRSY